MQDNQPTFKPLDPGRVDMLDQLERQYWAQELRCTEDQLAEAVAKVGAHVAALRDYLHKTL
jgi:hypothetical protein